LREIVYILPRNLTEAPVWERDEDRHLSKEVNKHVLADPVNLISSQFAPKEKYEPRKQANPAFSLKGVDDGVDSCVDYSIFLDIDSSSFASYL